MTRVSVVLSFAAFVMCGQAFAMPEIDLSVSENYTCVIDDEGLTCGGSDRDVFDPGGRSQYEFQHQISFPEILNPRRVSVSGTEICAIGDNGVICWGKGPSGTNSVPGLKNPREVLPGRYSSCAIDDDGVKCWPMDGDAPSWPSLEIKNPRQLTGKFLHQCVLGDEGVKCWGSNEDGQCDVPSLKNPRQISAGFGNTCALSDGGVKCWGEKENGVNNVPPLKNPRQVSVGGGHACALDDEGVKCWGANFSGQTNVPHLTHPKQISSGYNSSCAIADEGLKCWGSSEGGDWIKNVFIFGVLKQSSAPQRSRFYSEQSFLEDRFEKDHSLIEARYLFYSLLVDAVESTPSEKFVKVLIPKYREFVARLKTDGKFADPTSLRDTHLNRQVALKSIHAAILVALEFMTPEKRTEIQPMIRTLGIAYGDPIDANVKSVLSDLAQNHAILNELSGMDRSAFLPKTIDRAKSWLEAKIH